MAQKTQAWTRKKLNRIREEQREAQKHAEKAARAAEKQLNRGDPKVDAALRGCADATF